MMTQQDLYEIIRPFGYATSTQCYEMADAIRKALAIAAPDTSARDAALEEAALECMRTERRPVEMQHCGDVDYLVNDYPSKCADAIRALKTTSAIRALSAAAPSADAKENGHD